MLSYVFLFLFFAAAGTICGAYKGFTLQGSVAGVLFGLAAIFFKRKMEELSLGSVIGGLFGLSAGMLLSRLLLAPFKEVAAEDLGIASLSLGALFGYTGLIVGLSRGDKLTATAIIRLFKGLEYEQDIKVLDTSSIIDGRIADVIETGFLGGTIVIPQFILQELQYVADSPDPLRRVKGKRGLEVLQRIRKMSGIEVRITDEDFPRIKEVDAKLVAAARLLHAKIITNDLNLNKVAELQGVSVLNINDLSNVLKPVVLPGETLKLFVAKEGKEPNQGVAYLEDGTMAVIENGRRLIGRNVDAVVISILQTTAGRMVFARPSKEDE